jgi:hypothetical protein
MKKEELTPEEEKRFYNEVNDTTPTPKQMWQELQILRAQILAHKCPTCVHYVPMYNYPIVPNPVTHYHNGMPCYNNPCVWC